MLTDELTEQTWLANLVDHPGYIKLLEVFNEAANSQAESIEFSTNPSEILTFVSDWKAFRRLVRLLHTPAEIKENLIRIREEHDNSQHPLRDPLAPPVPYFINSNI